MRAEDIMTRDPACCTPDTKLREVAQLMVEHDCGEIPVVKSKHDATPVGVLTDRDIVCRIVAEGKNPVDMTAADCMSTPCVSVTEDSSVDDCCRIMEENQIRRVPVVDHAGSCCGIVAQADVAMHTDLGKTGHVVGKVSQPSEQASRVR